MSHNPNRAAGASRKKARRNNPHAGHRRRRPTTPQGVDYGDIHSRSITDRGWKVEYFGGDDFEVVYELIAAGNATGKIKNDDADRTVRVLEGILYVLVPGSLPAEVRKNQVCTFPKGTEYELSSSMHGDVEVLFCRTVSH
jgi:mannose-6-phosphate isomerase-like protein (cupin superfamily)